MKPGDCSDAYCTRHADSGLLPACSLHDGEKNPGYAVVTFRWLESLFEKDELDSDWSFLTEETPFWARWWFRTGATVLCIGIVWIFWPFL